MEKEIYKKIDELWEKHRLSMRPKLWRFDIVGHNELNILIGELIRIKKKDYLRQIYEQGLFAWRDLMPKEQKVLELRFIEFKNLEEVGKEFGVTRERVRQMEARALEKLTNEKSHTRYGEQEDDNLRGIGRC